MNRVKNTIKKILKLFGPGFISGAADDDPSGIATYSQTGAIFGYKQLWTSLFVFPFLTVVQEMCGRIGIVTGKGLAGVARKHYSKPVLFFSVGLLAIVNIINLGANLGAMVSSVQLLIGIPTIILFVFIVFGSLALQIFIPYKAYSRYLKYLAFALVAYIITAFLVKQDWPQAIYFTVVPNFDFSKTYLLNIVAILGTTISPYLFFWQAGEEVEEELAKNKIKGMGWGTPNINIRDIRQMKNSTIAGMFFSCLAMYFIILTTASTLHIHGIENIETAAQAAEAIRPFAGNFTFLLFTLGIIGTGLLANPVLAGSASYAVSECFGWKTGLYRKLKSAKGFYGIIIAVTMIGLLVNFSPIPPFKMLYYSAVLNGICAPPLLIMIMYISNNNKIMGKYTNSRFSNILGWIIIAFMSAAAVGLLITHLY